MSVTLKRKIAGKKAKIAVIGLGYVGLPLAACFAKAGFKVYGLDKNEKRVAKLKAKKSYISDVPTSVLKSITQRKRFEAHTDFALLAEMDVIIICVPTPLKRKYTPDITFILSAVKTVCRYLTKDTLVVLESTTYPGTTQEIIRPALETKRLKAERDFYLAFSPERIDPGNKTFPVHKIPKIVGGLSPKSTELTRLLYSKVIDTIHPVSSPKAAEMTKLLENSFRIINIGWINEVAMMCRKLGINVWEVIDAAKTKPFGFMPFYPGLGVGGHCIPDDPLYLYWKAKHQGFSSRFIKLSSDVNSAMPEFAIQCLRTALKTKKKKLTGSRILVVGVTYKKDVKDLRKSPPLKLIEQLKKKKARVDYFDPIIPYLKIGTIDLNSIKLTKASVAKYDCVVIACDHTGVNYRLIRQNAKLIFDVRNVYAGVTDKKIIRL